MGRKSRLKKERQQIRAEQPIIILDEHTQQEHIFSQQQMKVIADMVARARKEGREKAAFEFVEWFNHVTEVKGIGPKLQRDLANHFLAYGPGRKQL
jgi:NADPH-dependent glutamate synthase beta subunit-like oxidoreductase